MRSGFPSIDLFVGGYPVGAYVVFKTLGGEVEQDALQRFVERQILRLSLPAPTGLGKRVLLLSAGMCEEEVGRSLLMTAGQMERSGVLAKASLYVSCLGKERMAQSPEGAVDGLLKDLEKYITATNYDCVVIDDIGKVLPTADAGDEGKVLSDRLSELAERAETVVIVTDYENTWDNPWDKEKGCDGYAEVLVNEDVHGRTQAEVCMGRSKVVIEDINGDMSNIGLELVGMVMEQRRGNSKTDVPAGDEVAALALSAAVLVERINELLKGGKGND